MLYYSPFFTIYCSLVIFIFGAAMGSFLNCTAWRIVHGESLLKGRSHCDICGHVLGVGDLFPIVSFLIHKGRCRYCGATLSRRHLVAEVLTAFTFLAILLEYDISLSALFSLVVASLLLVSAFADLEGLIIPDRFIIIGIIIRVLFFIFAPQVGEGILSSAIGGVAVGGGLLLIVIAYEKIRKKEAMGGGDIKLLFLTGIYFGWIENILCLLLACVIGLIFGVIYLKKAESEESSPFPFGPAIAAAGIITALLGSKIVSTYLSLF